MIIADSNILLDVIDGKGVWFDWSVARLDEALAAAGVGINPIVYAEIAPAFPSLAELEAFVTQSRLAFRMLTRDALFEAGVAHASYRANGGKRDRVLPDFLIGAQARVSGDTILTRDPRRYRTYFPTVELITP